MKIPEFLNPKDKRFWLIVAVALLSVAIILVVTTIYANKFAVFQDRQFYVTITEPHEGQVFYEHTYFSISGYALGKPVSKVYVWDKDYNVGVLCGVAANHFNKEFYSDDFSAGTHTLCVQAVSTDGSLSNIATVTIEIRKPTVTVSTPEGYMSDALPDPLSTLFRPVEVAARQVIVFISGGTDPEDLNGDNIPDIYQISPIAPPYNPYGIPVTFTLIAIGLFVVIVLIIYVIRKMLATYITKKYEHEEKIAANPEARKYELEKLKLQLKIAKAQTNPERIKQLEKRIAELEKKVKQPIIINVGGNKKVKKIKEEK